MLVTRWGRKILTPLQQTSELMRRLFTQVFLLKVIMPNM